MLPRLANGGQLAPLFKGQGRAASQQARVTKNGVHGSADFMTDRGHKAPLNLASFFGFCGKNNCLVLYRAQLAREVQQVGKEAENRANTATQKRRRTPGTPQIQLLAIIRQGLFFRQSTEGHSALQKQFIDCAHGGHSMLFELHQGRRRLTVVKH